MTTKTDFHSIMELKEKFHPETRGIISSEEAALVRSTLEISTRNNIELQNVRDMFVMLYGQWADNMESHDRMGETMSLLDVMSSVCAVIDNEKWNREMAV